MLTVKLQKGLKVGEVEHTEAVLQEHTAGMVIEAQAESEVLIQTPNDGYQLVTSPSKIGIAVLRRQIVSIGTIKGPIELNMIKLLSADDLDRLNDAAAKLELAAAAVRVENDELGKLSEAERVAAFGAALTAIEAAVRAARGVSSRGRSDPAGSGSA